MGTQPTEPAARTPGSARMRSSICRTASARYSSFCTGSRSMRAVSTFSAWKPVSTVDEAKKAPYHQPGRGDQHKREGNL